MLTFKTDQGIIHFEKFQGTFTLDSQGNRLKAPAFKTVYKLWDGEEKVSEFYLSSRFPWVAFNKLPRHYTPAQIMGVKAFEVTNKDGSLSSGMLEVPNGLPLTAVLVKRGKMWRLSLVYTKTSYYKDLAHPDWKGGVFPRYSSKAVLFELTKKLMNQNECGFDLDALKALGVTGLESVFNNLR